MLIRKIGRCAEIVAGDGTRLREILHPDREYPFSGRYSLAHACLAAGASSGPHRLKSSEVYYLLDGRGEMHIDDDSAEVSAGDTVEIPPGAVQWIKNTGEGELVFLCLVDPAWREEDEAVL
ncbi:MAG: cupin domain-containing protein [Candidatus Zixiibacteriota bacterium]|nr:MAG: cupin domain-containing protein [candidate division Zixibacteria bacterium]